MSLTFMPEEVAPPSEALSLSPKKTSKQLQEEQELLEVSLLDDDDFAVKEMQNTAEPVEKTMKQSSPIALKTISAKPSNTESSIFNELQGIDFDTEISQEENGKFDWSVVS